MNRFKELQEQIADENPDALFADGLDEALIGPARRCGQPTLAAYSVSRALRILVERDGMTYEEALEFFEFNTAGAWVGENTPMWIYDAEGPDESSKADEPGINAPAVEGKN